MLIGIYWSPKQRLGYYGADLRSIPAGRIFKQDTVRIAIRSCPKYDRILFRPYGRRSSKVALWTGAVTV